MRRDAPDHHPKPSEKPKPKPSEKPKPKPDSKPKPKCTFRGVIAVKRLSDGACLGYVSKNTCPLYHYQYQDISNALIVTFDTDSKDSKDQVCQINLTPENSDAPGFPYLGLVQGRDDVTSDLAAKSFQYTYLANTNPTPPGSPPAYVGNSYSAATGLARTSESAVWTFDPVTKDLCPRWVNTDKSIPKVDYFVQSTSIYVGGDAVAFHTRYPAPVTLIKFEFVEL